jgi:hypothetical protein
MTDQQSRNTIAGDLGDSDIQRKFKIAVSGFFAIVILQGQSDEITRSV